VRGLGDNAPRPHTDGQVYRAFPKCSSVTRVTYRVVRGLRGLIAGPRSPIPRTPIQRPGFPIRGHFFSRSANPF
jgi:hypothetical protein